MTRSPTAFRSPRFRRSTAADRLQDQLDRAIKGGARVVFGEKRDGNFFAPMVLTDVTPDNDAYREELFGPVAVVYKVGSEEEAVKLANGTPYGLGASVFTTDTEQAERVANEIDAGMVYVNIVGADVPSCRSVASSARLGPRAWQVRRGRVRQQEADPGRLTGSEQLTAGRGVRFPARRGSDSCSASISPDLTPSLSR